MVPLNLRKPPTREIGRERERDAAAGHPLGQACWRPRVKVQVFEGFCVWDNGVVAQQGAGSLQHLLTRGV